jgi:hypothetical protein
MGHTYEDEVEKVFGGGHHPVGREACAKDGVVRHEIRYTRNVGNRIEWRKAGSAGQRKIPPRARCIHEGDEGQSRDLS